MDCQNAEACVFDALEGRRLLDHPFYRRWEQGRLSRIEIATYAAQYWHFEAMLPSFLERLAGVIAAAMESGQAGARSDIALQAVQGNLADELGDPVPHLTLFEEFTSAVLATTAPAAPATRGLLGAYERVAGSGPAAALAGLAAYEVQAADIATTKAAGLRAHYNLDGRGCAFWDLHAKLETDHADWTIQALAAIDADAVDVQAGAETVAAAWWAFLDEREAATAAAA